MIASVLMTIKQVTIKKFRANYPAKSQAIDGFILEYFLYCMMSISLFNSPDYTFTWADQWIGLAAGVLYCISRTLLAIAAQIGIAAAAQALNATHAIHQAFWGVVIGGQTISWLQGVGVGLTVLGVIIISAIKMIIDKFCRPKKTEETQNKVSYSELPAIQKDS